VRWFAAAPTIGLHALSSTLIPDDGANLIVRSGQLVFDTSSPYTTSVGSFDAGEAGEQLHITGSVNMDGRRHAMPVCHYASQDTAVY